MSVRNMIDRKQALMGILIWALVVGAFVTLTGVDDFINRLDAISAPDFGLMLVAVSIGVISMGACLYVIARSLGIGASLIETIFLNTSVSLAHNLTPFGQAGGAPVGAVILSQRFTGSYEESLAAISMKDIVSFAPAIFVFTVGGGYLAVYEQSISSQIRPLVAAFALFVVFICVVALAVYRYPDFMRGIIRRLVIGGNRLAAYVPILPSLEPADIDARITNFLDSIAEVAGSKKTMVLASVLATSSFVAQGCLLWITLAAIGVDISIPLAIFTVQISLLASGLPLPGGSGGVEAVQALMLVATAGVTKDAVLPAVILSRGLVFWTPIVVGSMTLVVLQLQGRFTGSLTE
ncbi:YbhN family protein [Halovenus rubra]|uniref:YbhN family protein n=2 Tax=Halovenus rubra TaxID=869890 RepID=A0ABD5X6U5_9EURY|nr:flippase-like domain-containing protein [Halovenus rubra]